MKRHFLGKLLALGCGLLVLVPTGTLFGGARPSRVVATSDVRTLASPANIEQYFRDRFLIPDSTIVSARPLQHADVPHFYQTVVTVNDGKQLRAFNAFVTDDARCLAIGSVFPLSAASGAELIRCLRQAASLPAAAKVTVSALTKARLPGFFHARVTMELGTKSQTGDLFVTGERRVGILGLLMPYRRDFVEQLISTKDLPALGAAHAPVTIVEYADLECPYCAAFQKFLENEFLANYGSRVRVIYKELPLSFHPWAASAAVANECGYQIDPRAFFRYRSLIFGSQDSISAANVRERLLALGDAAGLDRLRLSACLDAKASQGRIEASRIEAETLGISGTPTFVINGRVVSAPPTTTFYMIVDEALAESR